MSSIRKNNNTTTIQADENQHGIPNPVNAIIKTPTIISRLKASHQLLAACPQ
jgi:hypothetical protein